MFNSQFYPTPQNVIEMMLNGESINGKTILEPSAGKGDIVDFCKIAGASVIACENNEDLRSILANKCELIGSDFLQVTSEQVSHVDFIIMNPPFNADERHILHAYNIAPAGCKIIALCNLNTVKNTYYSSRKELLNIVESCGRFEDWGKCFDKSERQTGVEVACIKIQKEGASYKQEFEGFFMDEEPEQAEGQESGLMSYNFVRDLVHRYISAVKLYDEQLETGVRMHQITSGFYYSNLSFHCTEEGKPKARNEFKKDLQKSAWKFIFSKMDMQKHTTRGLREDINKFIETQSEIPFTMKNIFRMLEIVIGTTGQRMDKALMEVFDKVTRHHDENRYNVEGWKTNSHYLLNQKFIFPYVVENKWGSSTEMKSRYNSNWEIMEDLEKALCYITGDEWNSFKKLESCIDGCTFGKWNDSHFFRFKGFKKGTLHCEFKSEELWARFNQRIAKLKGYPLFEHTNAEAKKKAAEDKKRAESSQNTPTATGKVLFTVKIKAA